MNKVKREPQQLSQIRPITAISAIRKAIEFVLKDRLELAMRKSIDKAQTGFVPGLGTEVNL